MHAQAIEEKHANIIEKHAVKPALVTICIQRPPLSNYLYSETTSILLPLFRDHLYSITSIQRPPLSNYLYSETTSILLPLFRDHLYSITSIQRPPLFYYLYSETTSIQLPLFRDHLYSILAMHAWSGFTVLLCRILNNGMYV